MWIHSKKLDISLILLPHCIGLILLLLFPSYFMGQKETSTFDWLILILFIDVAHVYSTLFRTYFFPEARKLNQRLLIFIPLISYCLGVIAFEISFDFFWKTLAYLAVFHFIRQQYGLIRLYQQNRNIPIWVQKTDTWFVYLFTLIPVVIWHLDGPKNFVWFTKNDFYFLSIPLLSILLKLVLVILFLLLFTSFLIQWKKGIFTLPKNIILLATALNWSIGIVVLNGDLSFTLLNVVAHGIPYMALVWVQGTKSKTKSTILHWVFSTKGWVSILLVCILFGFIEESLWDRFIWQDHEQLFGLFDFINPIESPKILSFLVPLLALPQITHYVIDGFIWKKSSPNSMWKEPK